MDNVPKSGSGRPLRGRKIDYRALAGLRSAPAKKPVATEVVTEEEPERPVAEVDQGDGRVTEEEEPERPVAEVDQEDGRRRSHRLAKLWQNTTQGERAATQGQRVRNKGEKEKSRNRENVEHDEQEGADGNILDIDVERHTHSEGDYDVTVMRTRKMSNPKFGLDSMQFDIKIKDNSRRPLDLLGFLSALQTALLNVFRELRQEFPDDLRRQAYIYFWPRAAMVSPIPSGMRIIAE